MPPSQLKRLKVSLREHGIVGPQKSRKNVKNVRKNINQERKVTRELALASIREQLNPFEYKPSQSRSKLETTSQNITKIPTGRPSTKKSYEEETVQLNPLNIFTNIINNLLTASRSLFRRAKAQKKGWGNRRQTFW